jgi:hypothetical protein
LRSLRCSRAMRSTITGLFERILFNSFVSLKNKLLGMCAHRNQGLRCCYFEKRNIALIPVCKSLFFPLQKNLELTAV